MNKDSPINQAYKEFRLTYAADLRINNVDAAYELFSAFLVNRYGCQLNDYKVDTTLTIVDPKKYMLFQLKYPL